MVATGVLALGLGPECAIATLAHFAFGKKRAILANGGAEFVGSVVLMRGVQNVAGTGATTTMHQDFASNLQL